jgi:hypothetical protein
VISCVGQTPIATLAKRLASPGQAKGWRTIPLRNAEHWSIRGERAKDDWDTAGHTGNSRHYEILVENSPIVEALDKRQPEDANEPE